MCVFYKLETFQRNLLNEHTHFIVLQRYESIRHSFFAVLYSHIPTRPHKLWLTQKFFSSWKTAQVNAKRYSCDVIGFMTFQDCMQPVLRPLVWH